MYAHTSSVKIGLENILDHFPVSLQKKRLGLLCNQASTDNSLRHASRLISRHTPGRLCALFSPQHGFLGEKQDNMHESPHSFEPYLKIPVYSLYGITRNPTKEMIDQIDILLIDLQDVGTRVYTFIYTMSNCMEMAKAEGKKVVVLDRPNPINGIQVEGNLLLQEMRSFVGQYPIPMRHGLTIGEIALLFNNVFGIGCDLEVIPMKGWKRGMYFSDTGLWWVPPSPNLPTPRSALVYPGQVLWEGTNVSEGRGTTLPFELFGAPFFDSRLCNKIIEEWTLPGIILREVAFEPTSNKWHGRLCKGFQIHVKDRQKYQPYITTLKLMESVLRWHLNEFEWKAPPYEYEHEKLPIDLITGDPNIRLSLENQCDMNQIALSWETDLKEFERMRREVFLYGF